MSQNPTQAQIDWMGTHYARMLTYSPYFDSRLWWFSDAWVYKDLYAMYPGTALAAQHPEWILRDAGGTFLYIPWACSGGTCPQYAADIGNQAFRDNWIREAAAVLDQGYFGLFVDDVNMFLSRVGNNWGQAVTPIDPRTGAPMTEANWRRYMAEFTEQIRAAFPTHEIVHNSIWYVGVDDPYVQRELLAADVHCLERGVNDSGIVGGWGPYGFDTFLSYIDWLHTNGRGVWFLAAASTNAEREYGLAAYFLVSDGSDSLDNNPGGSPGDWWSGYDIDLGGYAGPRYTWNGVTRRDFENGIVLLNPPGGSQRTIALDGTYIDVGGAQRTSITLSGTRGAVLRRAGAATTTSTIQPASTTSTSLRPTTTTSTSSSTTTLRSTTTTSTSSSTTTVRFFSTTTLPPTTTTTSTLPRKKGNGWGKVKMALGRVCATDADCSGICATRGRCGSDLCAVDADGGGVQARFSLRGRRPRLIVRTVFIASMPDPETAGVTLELRAANGEVIYETSLPGQALEANSARTVYRYPGRASLEPPPPNEGFQQLTIRVEGNVVDVRAVVTSATLAVLTEDTEFNWVLRLGQTCLGSPSGLLKGFRHGRSHR